jgi:hypothetical protein
MAMKLLDWRGKALYYRQTWREQISLIILHITAFFTNLFDYNPMFTFRDGHFVAELNRGLPLVHPRNQSEDRIQNTQKNKMAAPIPSPRGWF